MPWARFYTISFYWDMALPRPKDSRGQFRLSHQSIRDLVSWQLLSIKELDGKPMHPTTPDAAMCTDASDGYEHQDEVRRCAGYLRTRKCGLRAPFSHSLNKTSRGIETEAQRGQRKGFR